MTKFYQMLLESRYTGSKTPIFQLNPSAKDLKTLRFAKDPDGRVHSCITIDGKDYRCRSEMLVIKDDTVFALKLEDGKLKDGRPYVLPGGSLEEGLTVEENAAKETKEEARINVKNPRYSGISYGVQYTEGSTNKHFNYYGAITFVCIGEFDSVYKGYINMDDTEPEMLKSGKFYNPSDIEFIKYHKMALKKAGL